MENSSKISGQRARMGLTSQRGNSLTLGFLSGDQQDCSDVFISGSLVFTTAILPLSRACLNIDDLFGGDPDPGFTHGSTSPDIDIANEGAYCFRWGLQNTELYESSAIYSRILIQSINTTAELEDHNTNIEAGEDAQWDVFFASDGCAEETPLDVVESGRGAWCLYNCQADISGLCESASYEF